MVSCLIGKLLEYSSIRKEKLQFLIQVVKIFDIRKVRFYTFALQSESGNVAFLDVGRYHLSK